MPVTVDVGSRELLIEPARSKAVVVREGPPGPVTEWVKGTATTGAPGSAADFEVVQDGVTATLSMTIPQGVEGASAGVLTVKGDLLSRDAAAAVRVPVGSAGQVLTADPAAAAGVAWQGVRRGEWEQVATWAALPASGSWPGRRVKVLDGLGLLVAVWDGAKWQVDPVSDTGLIDIAAKLTGPFETVPYAMIRRHGGSVTATVRATVGSGTLAGVRLDSTPSLLTLPLGFRGQEFVQVPAGGTVAPQAVMGLSFTSDTPDFRPVCIEKTDVSRVWQALQRLGLHAVWSVSQPWPKTAP